MCIAREKTKYTTEQLLRSRLAAVWLSSMGCHPLAEIRQRSPIQRRFGGENSTRYAYGLDGKALTPDDFLDHCESIALDPKALESLEASPLTESVQWLDQSPPFEYDRVRRGIAHPVLPLWSLYCHALK